MDVRRTQCEVDSSSKFFGQSTWNLIARSCHNPEENCSHHKKANWGVSHCMIGLLLHRWSESFCIRKYRNHIFPFRGKTNYKLCLCHNLYIYLFTSVLWRFSFFLQLHVLGTIVLHQMYRSWEVIKIYAHIIHIKHKTWWVYTETT